MTAVAFVGLGNMGGPMSARLVAAGHAVRGFDLSPDARQALDDTGGTSAPDLAGAVRDAEIVILMLPNSDIVEATVDDLDVPPGTLVVDMSSSEPLRTRALAEAVADRGITLVDAPVSGGVARARTGKLTIMTGGSPEALARVEPVLACLGTTTRAGEVGSGHAVKALNNLMSAAHLLVTSEAMLAGERFGLDPATMLSIFNSSSGRSGSTENKWPNFILPETYDSGFGLRLMLKDMRIATGLAASVGTPDPLGEAAVSFWERAADALDPGADHTEIVNWLRKD
ncbi:NAD(P)-dependent oxidoreductase [Actinoplanes sp. LDG1-06]|uniref:NAD(P)-dependent oxidoreductase n=1 Tax=Paractinoplanes ovalisporus TaxID=2810368 RepID=A0ABS2A6L4_9ACTN|nr:NAD(P)-dependent oxidoreductase [Actinoplanes ovalisporus]MBM2614871.1 NAD(P)-dependent oxidoreductase [Actinoplanes ovalisporus]